MDDPFFGQLTKHALTKTWQGRFDVDGEVVEISFRNLDADLEPAKELAKLIKRRIRSITARVAKDVAPYVYDHIVPRPTPKELKAKLQLHCMLFAVGVGAECFFDCDEELFGDHEVCAWIEENGDVKNGHLAG